MRTKLTIFAAAALTTLLAAAGCASGGEAGSPGADTGINQGVPGEADPGLADPGLDQPNPDESTPADGDSANGDTGEGESESTGADCSVTLFDGDDFSDTPFTLTEPGKYADLSDLPGADQDWTDEADSIKVGADATVTIWSETDFGGTSQELEPGSEHGSVDEPSSLELTC